MLRNIPVRRYFSRKEPLLKCATQQLSATSILSTKPPASTTGQAKSHHSASTPRSLLNPSSYRTSAPLLDAGESLFSPGRSSFRLDFRQASEQAGFTSPRPHGLKEPLQWSYLSGGGSESLLGLTVGQSLDRAVKLFPDREAVVSLHQGRRMTFRELDEESRRVASGLLALGLEPGQRLGLWGGNSTEWVVTYFAAARAGLVLVNINPSFLADELLYCINKVELAGIVCAESFKGQDYYDVLRGAVPEVGADGATVCSARAPSLRRVVFLGDTARSGTVRYGDLKALATPEADAQLDALVNRIQFDQPFNIQFTSGTTGNPKAAMLSHHNIVNNAYFIGHRKKMFEHPHRICVSVPLYHCFGCVAGVQSGALFGATCVLPAEAFSGSRCIDAVLTENISSVYGTPTMFVDMLNIFRSREAVAPPSLFTGIMAGAPCPPELVSDVIDHLKMKDFLVMYGMTETSPVTFQCFPSDSPAVRSSTIGFPSDHTEVRVVNDEGEVVPIGVEGELQIRGYCNFVGYYGDEQKTRETVTPEGWLKTGDLAVLDARGYASIRGRKKDLVIRGGENVYPAEVENLLLGCPGVMEAQVFGVPDARLGEEVAVWVRLTEGQTLTREGMRAWCEGRMASYKIPRYFYVKDAFPTTVTGKIQKFVMRDETVRMLQEDPQATK